MKKLVITAIIFLAACFGAFEGINYLQVKEAQCSALCAGSSCVPGLGCLGGCACVATEPGAGVCVSISHDGEVK